MRITTWNVAGLRALLKKDGWAWLQEHDPDVICLQEIKALPEQLTETDHNLFSGYQVFWNPAEKKGYSGTLTLVKDRTVTFRKGLGIERFDNEGRTIQTEFDDFTLFNLYIPNGGRDLGRVPFKLEFYAALLELCQRQFKAGKQVILCGDLNTAHEEIDVNNPKSKSQYTGFLPEERAWITKFLSSGFVDVFRALYPEQVQYTYWSYVQNQRSKNNGWRLDYFLVSQAVAPRVKQVLTFPEVPGSDHCPVTLVLD